MTWRSFVEYVTMLELGQADSIYRNYDLANLNGSKPGVVIDRAFARMGFDQKNTARPFVLPMIRAQLRNMGYDTHTMSDEEFGTMVREWYNWDRIRKGELPNWTFRSTVNLLL